MGDKTSCPQITPNKATIDEIKIMKRLVLSEKYTHFPIWSLSMYAMRNGILYLNPNTWYKYIKMFEWKRPKLRKYFKSKIGIRATFINQIWHLDITVIKLLDGTKVFIQAVIDNKSRYILAWEVFTKILGNNTEKLLRKALTNAMSINTNLFPELFVDSGIENINSSVDKLINENKLKRTIAQIEIHYSNSLIEALFRSFKNNYLYQQDLTTFEKITKQTNFYFTQHNEVIPHNALNGAIPKEIYFDEWNDEILQKVKDIQKQKAKERREINNALVCKILNGVQPFYDVVSLGLL